MDGTELSRTSGTSLFDIRDLFAIHTTSVLSTLSILSGFPLSIVLEDVIVSEVKLLIGAQVVMVAMYSPETLYCRLFFVSLGFDGTVAVNSPEKR